jgi:hypothetical protein
VLDKAQKFVERVHGKFCKKTDRVASCAANGFGEMELGRESKKVTLCE